MNKPKKIVQLSSEFTALRGKLRGEMNEIADLMAAGGCASWENYQKLAGLIEGLARAERHMLDLAEKNQDDNE